VHLRSCGLGGLGVAAAHGQQGQLLVRGPFFFQRFQQPRHSVLVSELLGQRGDGAVGSDFVMLDFLRAANQCCIAHRALLNALDDFLAFFHQAFHRRALDPLQADAQHLHHLVDALDLALGLLKVCLERSGKCGVLCGPGEPRQGLGQLLLGTVDVGQFVDEKVFSGLDSQGALQRGRSNEAIPVGVGVRGTCSERRMRIERADACIPLTPGTGRASEPSSALVGRCCRLAGCRQVFAGYQARIADGLVRPAPSAGQQRAPCHPLELRVGAGHVVALVAAEGDSGDLIDAASCIGRVVH